GWKGACRAFAWSFYSQGSNEDRQTSADEFFDAALPFFGHDGSAFASQHDKGAALARLIGQAKSLLILDGLEPLQYAAGSGRGVTKSKREGGIKDQAIAALLRGLADQSKGFCLVTTRLEISELHEYSDPLVVKLPLKELPLASAAALLRARGVCPQFPPA